MGPAQRKNCLSSIPGTSHKTKQGQSPSTEIDKLEPEKPKTSAAKSKPVIEVAVSGVFNKVSDSMYLESESDIDRFIDALQSELKSAIDSDKCV